MTAMYMGLEKRLRAHNTCSSSSEALIYFPMSFTFQILPRTNLILGRRPSRHNSRPLPVPPRHPQNAPPILRRLRRLRRLHRHIPRRRQRDRRIRPRRSALLHNLRQREARTRACCVDLANRNRPGVRCQGREWSGHTHAGREFGRGGCVCGACAD